MISPRRLIWSALLPLMLAGCAAAPSPTSTPPIWHVSCHDATPIPNGTSLPPFTPSYPCQLEQSSFHAECLETDATPPLTCVHDEKVNETALNETAGSVFFKRVYSGSAGCWDGVNWGQTSLRVCQKSDGAITPLADDVLGDPLPSPDGAWLAFVAAEPGSIHMKPHLYRVRKDGSDMQRLDTATFPYSVVGIALKGWSTDGQWIDVTVWDGTENGHHPLRIKAGPS